MTVTVKRIGGSLAVVIPAAVAAESRLAEGMPLDVTATAAGILFRPAGRRARRSMAELVKAIDPAAYAGHTAAVAADPAVGREVG